MISKTTATDIALAHREIESAEKLLAEIDEALDRRTIPDIRDAFGRRQDGLTLGVPTGNSGHCLFNVPYTMARPIIRAHIAQQRSLIETLSAAALVEASVIEARSDATPKSGAAEGESATGEAGDAPDIHP
jgi:hypothetical protein